MPRPKKYDNPNNLSYYALNKLYDGNPPIKEPVKPVKKSVTEVKYFVKRIDKDVIVRFD